MCWRARAARRRTSPAAMRLMVISLRRRMGFGSCGSCSSPVGRVDMESRMRCVLCRRVRAPACVDGRRVCARDFLRPDVMSASTAPPVLLCSALHRSSLSPSLLLHAPSDILHDLHDLHDLDTHTHRTSTDVVRPEPAPARQVPRRRRRGRSSASTSHTDAHISSSPFLSTRCGAL